jgi:hypothetical protein
MDHDTHEPRISKLERFLDMAAPGWRDEKNWNQMKRGGAGLDAAPGELVRDDEQTKRDREALGLTDDVVVRGGRRFLGGTNPGVDDGKDAELRENARAGKGAVSNETAQKQERQDMLQRLEAYRDRDGYQQISGDETDDQLRAALEANDRRAKAHDETPAGAVALEGARANPAAEQALQTKQNPAREQRAEEQRDQKAAVDR